MRREEIRMGYIVLEALWNIGLVGRAVQYSLSEIAAIKLDDEIHSIDTFRFIKESEDGYLKSELHFDTEGAITVGSDKDGWIEFRKWAREEDVILIWDKDFDKLVKNMNREAGIISPRRFIHMEELYVAMTASVRECVPKYTVAMNEMGLTIDLSMVRYPVYKTQSMVRLYRKLRNVGNKKLEDKFDQYVRTKDFSVIRVTNFFPKLDRIEANNKTREVRELLRERGVDARISGSIVKFETSQANFVFNYDSKSGRLTYTSKNFYKGLRFDDFKLDADIDMSSILDAYINRATEIDKRLALGVGSKEITNILKKLCV